VDSRVGGTFGKYKINGLLGKGGMGEVYEAYDTDKGRTVALKILKDQYAQDETFRTRFLRESRAAAILQEPHVIPIHDWGEIDDVLFIDMRLVDGQTLHDMLKIGALSPERAVAIIRQVGAALDAAHAQGLIHRDVKPQNIMVTADDFAYLVDFGIAQAKGDTNVTMAGYQVGSLDYIAPERLSDEAITPAVDVYSLACVLYEALTGATPYPSHSLQQVMAAHISSPPPQPSAVNPHVPASLDDVTARGMAKHPDDRYGSAGALGRAAQRALTAEPHVSSTADTMFAQQPPGQSAADWPGAGQPGSPTTGPTVVVRADDLGARSPQWVLPTVIAISAALLLGAIGVVIGLLAKKSPEPSGPATIGYPTATTEYSATTIYQTTSSSSPRSSTSLSTATPSPQTQDPEQRLRQLASADRSYVSTYLAGYWVPQLSSKRPGVEDPPGVRWDNAMTLQEHLQLRQRYGTSLLWSGDWSTFSDDNFWVTVVNAPSLDAESALAWCRKYGFDRDHCFAKFISTTHPIAGSTKYN
jgi:serine/threonine-protein kinase